MKKSDTAIIFLNGAAPKPSETARLDFENCLTICADGAYKYAKKYVVPDIILGDFDSLNINNTIISENTTLVRYPEDKDFTDGHLAVVYAIEQGAKNLVILGASGGNRPDHEYNNYSLLALAKIRGVNAVLSCGRFDVYLTDGLFKQNLKKGKIISVVPFGGNTHILYTKGLEYPAVNLYINKTEPGNCVNTVSNKAKGGDAEVFIDGQAALIFVQK